MSRILLLTAHSIAEHDDLRMLSEMGHEVMSIGAYLDPANPADDKRPALPQVPPAPQELRDLVVGDQIQLKGHLPDPIIEWAEVIIAHHFVYDWIGGQWGRIRHKRVVWRTCGQTSPQLEQFMAYLRPEGLQIVRYSPREKFNGPFFAGQDALIRFGKEPSEWDGWTGEDRAIGNVTQDMVGRADACGLEFWLQATAGLPSKPAGPNSQQLPGGIGALDYEPMRDYLRRIRCYLYTGTKPAPYTLGLMEAMMTGVPVVSVGKQAWADPESWLEGVFEGAEIAGNATDSPREAHDKLARLLADDGLAQAASRIARQRAIELFGMDRVKAQWKEFLA